MRRPEPRYATHRVQVGWWCWCQAPGCGRRFAAKRQDAETCSMRCRQRRAYNRRLARRARGREDRKA